MRSLGVFLLAGSVVVVAGCGDSGFGVAKKKSPSENSNTAIASPTPAVGTQTATPTPAPTASPASTPTLLAARLNAIIDKHVTSARLSGTLSVITKTESFSR